MGKNKQLIKEQNAKRAAKTPKKELTEEERREGEIFLVCLTEGILAAVTAFFRAGAEAERRMRVEDEERKGMFSAIETMMQPDDWPDELPMEGGESDERDTDTQN